MSDAMAYSLLSRDDAVQQALLELVDGSLCDGESSDDCSQNYGSCY